MVLRDVPFVSFYGLSPFYRLSSPPSPLSPLDDEVDLNHNFTQKRQRLPQRRVFPYASCPDDTFSCHRPAHHSFRGVLLLKLFVLRRYRLAPRVRREDDTGIENPPFMFRIAFPPVSPPQCTFCCFSSDIPPSDFRPEAGRYALIS